MKKRRVYPITGSGTGSYQLATTTVDNLAQGDVAINCPGINAGEAIRVSPGTGGAGTGFGIVGAWCGTNNSVSVRFLNTSGIAAAPTAPTSTAPYFVIVDG